MARLVVMYSVLRNSHKKQLKQRRNERRLMRYMDKAFSMNEVEFQANYRVTKDLFGELYDNIKPFLPAHKRKNDISPKYKVLVALSFYATGSYQKLVGGTYGTLMSQQSVSRAIRDVTAALNHPAVATKWIRFPQNRQERDAIKRRFYERFNIPSVIGCIDGTHVAIIRPSENEERFFNRKHFHSRNVMIISDADLMILSVDASYGGASHDSFVWNQHPVKQHLIDLNNNGENVFLLGDSGYAQREYMMTPIIDAPQGSPEEYYTKLHCMARNTVERTIGVLKNRWRCLLRHRVLHYHPDVAAKIINACCVLHNMCLNRVDEDLEDNTAENENDFQDVTAQESSGSNTAAELRRGIEKRNALVQQLWASRR
ncbi:putative nuclease HARBI1 isoform X2 [Spodoptera litura]|uniref:Nuclease HARBI1 isoform X2 n=1 Tax=Spodoptera litura TaxID=69820 RepID=A0A9J7EDP7_SPOLT|nr:putative nuclease HARBI1 isoform X2 [Spodoptera litura]XP_022828428.1 putative nuclease HARBI1 isoform X2 [Spodoptera litura]